MKDDRKRKGKRLKKEALQLYCECRCRSAKRKILTKMNADQLTTMKTTNDKNPEEVASGTRKGRKQEKDD